MGASRVGRVAAGYEAEPRSGDRPRRPCGVRRGGTGLGSAYLDGAAHRSAAGAVDPVAGALVVPHRVLRLVGPRWGRPCSRTGCRRTRTKPGARGRVSAGFAPASPRSGTDEIVPHTLTPAVGWAGCGRGGGAAGPVRDRPPALRSPAGDGHHQRRCPARVPLVAARPPVT
ncbi:hypothetical protein GZL_06179 [Streptomyces sp. 769]|nr:hypothetical protein GZL_06179 [Streptomyces sp. 769]